MRHQHFFSLLMQNNTVLYMDINIALNDQAKCDLQSLLETNETKSTIQKEKKEQLLTT